MRRKIEHSRLFPSYSSHSSDLSVTVALVASKYFDCILDSVIGNGQDKGRVHALIRKQCTIDIIPYGTVRYNIYECTHIC